jgi:hypothetical protein
VIRHRETRVALRGWRDRETGTLHLRDCPDFERLDADRIEDAVWWQEEHDAGLCPWCFPGAREKRFRLRS